jgi:ATP-binding cassette subfamily F protein 2
LNFGRRYGLIGRNGSGKSTFLKALAEREIDIGEHIDIYLLDQEAEGEVQRCIPFTIANTVAHVFRVHTLPRDAPALYTSDQWLHMAVNGMACFPSKS